MLRFVDKMDQRNKEPIHSNAMDELLSLVSGDVYKMMDFNNFGTNRKFPKSAIK